MFRRTTPQIVGGGGIFDTAKSIYSQLPRHQKPRVREKALEFVFPTGAKVKYQHMQAEKDKYDIQGLQFTFIGVDEACQFEWTQLEYMMSRLRSDSRHPSRMVMSCNPDPDHKIKEMIQWYLDDEGYPILERDGILRYFVQLDGEYYWGNTEQELYDKFGDEVLPISFSFISAVITDNPIMMANNPSYLAFLNGLNEIDKARLRYGNWEARPQGANYFQRSWLQHADNIPMGARCCRSWDKAGTERTTENKHPDFTASIKMYRTQDGAYYLTGEYQSENKDEVTDTFGRFCHKAGMRDQLILKQAKHDGSDCVVVFPIDPAQAGKLEFAESSRKLIEEGFIVKSDPTPSNKSKLTKFSPFASAVENGLVYIVRSTFDDRTYETLMKELESFDGTRSTTSRKDDYVDAVSGAFSYLSQSRAIRPFQIPDINAPTIYSNMRD